MRFTLRLLLYRDCQTCGGAGGTPGVWKIDGYGWGTVRGVKNTRVFKRCACCHGVGAHWRTCGMVTA